MDDNLPDNCEGCKYFRVPPGGIPRQPNGGRCHRNSPGPYTGAESQQTHWPVVRKDDWCGQGQRAS